MVSHHLPVSQLYCQSPKLGRKRAFLWFTLIKFVSKSTCFQDPLIYLKHEKICLKSDLQGQTLTWVIPGPISSVEIPLASLDHRLFSTNILDAYHALSAKLCGANCDRS